MNRAVFWLCLLFCFFWFFAGLLFLGELLPDFFLINAWSVGLLLSSLLSASLYYRSTGLLWFTLFLLLLYNVTAVTLVIVTMGFGFYFFLPLIGLDFIAALSVVSICRPRALIERVVRDLVISILFLTSLISGYLYILSR